MFFDDLSVGIDMVEIPRIEKAMKKGSFLSFILGEEEYFQLKEKNFPIKSVAANFCAKEAFSKAIGTGFKNFKMKDVQILRDELGKPYIHLKNSAKMYVDKYQKNKKVQFSVSLTHTKEYASAVVVCFAKDK